MTKKILLVVLLFLVASMQTLWAQKMVVTMADDSKVVLDITEVKEVAFEEAEEPDEHEWVDLGLPSGTLWATCNVGASSPEEYGDYFAWGETEPKSSYDWSTYKYCMGEYNTLTKYCSNSSFGYNGFEDTLTELESADDAATANWGNSWQMPSDAQYTELINSSYTTTKFVYQKGVSGRLITRKSNSNSIFLPSSSYQGISLNDEITRYAGNYWSSSLRSYSSYGACGLYFSSSEIFEGNDYRCCGRSVRPVRVKAE